LPAVSVVVAELVADEEVALTLANVTGEPKLLPSTLNCTVPTGVAVADTVAVKVTDSPNTDGFFDELTTVVVLNATNLK
jgi:hypothetical protein